LIGPVCQFYVEKFQLLKLLLLLFFLPLFTPQIQKQRTMNVNSMYFIQKVGKQNIALISEKWRRAANFCES